MPVMIQYLDHWAAAAPSPYAQGHIIKHCIIERGHKQASEVTISLQMRFDFEKPKPLLSRLPGPARLYLMNSPQLTLFLNLYNTSVRRFEEYLLSQMLYKNWN
ncbi:hypothetical protein TNCV_3504851 [Trichonephila clavipes]|uniref:Uncharacterized protein n=1 Tax=Trichonephila clavipes TaxID=2585209 RepID=A0A8X6S193_TRICX|nr:hypothetical protein TNCV_3504851 [Trichonephila clavipes]